MIAPITWCPRITAATSSASSKKLPFNAASARSSTKVRTKQYPTHFTMFALIFSDFVASAIQIHGNLTSKLTTPNMHVAKKGSLRSNPLLCHAPLIQTQRTKLVRRRRLHPFDFGPTLLLSPMPVPTTKQPTAATSRADESKTFRALMCPRCR